MQFRTFMSSGIALDVKTAPVATLRPKINVSLIDVCLARLNADGLMPFLSFHGDFSCDVKI